MCSTFWSMKNGRENYRRPDIMEIKNSAEVGTQEAPKGSVGPLRIMGT